MNQKTAIKEKTENLGTLDPAAMTNGTPATGGKSSKNVVPRPGYIRYREVNGYVYYSWVRTEYTRDGPKQVVIKNFGKFTPPCLRLGPVDPKHIKKLMDL